MLTRDEHQCAHFDSEVAAFQRTLADIRALACSHPLASGQLARSDDGYGYTGSIVCDDCGDELRTLGRVVAGPNSTFCFA